ncbi:MAG: DUF1573 domain-containing protein [Nanoarchaeota archaeon]|nr:DUF1573 domain-containing protein [Nanoarchaeota archaeon]
MNKRIGKKEKMLIIVILLVIFITSIYVGKYVGKENETLQLGGRISKNQIIEASFNKKPIQLLSAKIKDKYIPEKEKNISLQTILIIIDEITFNKTSREVERLKKDIENGLNSEVNIVSREWESPEIIKQILQLNYESNNLTGAILIGEIPFMLFENPVLEGFESIPYPSDIYYMNLDRNFPDDDGNGIIDAASYIKYDYDNVLNEIWVGRIKSPKEGEEAINQIKKYLDRNHNFRTGLLEIDRKQILLSTVNIFDFGETYEEYNNSALEITNRMELYDFNTETELIYDSCESPNNCRIKEQFLKSIAKDQFSESINQNIELAYLNIHGGSSSFHLPNQTQITHSEIENNSPNVLFYGLISCGIGDFSEVDYLAGHLLFDGSGLGAIAYTNPVFANWETLHKEFKVMKNGIIFGEMIRETNHNGIIKHFLGDPTLAMRDKPTNVPEIYIQEEVIDLGNIRVNSSNPMNFIIRNNGDANLEIYGIYNFMSKNNVKSSGFPPVFYPFNILPGQTSQISLNFNPTQPGKYKGMMVLLTNDPSNTHSYLEFKAKVVGSNLLITTPIYINN